MKYRIICADPPWKYDNDLVGRVDMGGKSYPTMSLAAIKSLPVGGLAADDCLLFLWATMPKLKEAIEVIEAWGFKYITCAFSWLKLNPRGEGIYSGLGRWTNGNVELCLLGKKGSPKRCERNVKQVIMAPRSRHSEKPAEARDRIVRLAGDVPRIELFARDNADGWDAWGDEADSIVWLDAAFRGLPGRAGPRAFGILRLPEGFPFAKECGGRSGRSEATHA